MICNNCGKEIPEEANVCPLCGTPTANFQQPDVFEATAPVENSQPDPSAQPEFAPQGEPYAPPQQEAFPPYQPMPVYAPPVEQAPETTKPRSAYWAAILHLLIGELGFGYYYRGMKDKAKNCIIMFIVGILTSWLFVGAVLILVVEIINIVEAVKLFKGDYPTDAYGRTLYQEF